MPRLVHLSARFFSSLRRDEPSEVDLAWAHTALTAAEWKCWCALGPADRREAIRTAHRTAAALADTPHAGDVRYVGAALCHDVGKASARLGPVRRALATTLGAVWAPERVPGRAGQYLRHPAVGAALLEEAGARPEVVAWAGAHHDPSNWPPGIPREVCEALARADGEDV